MKTTAFYLLALSVVLVMILFFLWIITRSLWGALKARKRMREKAFKSQYGDRPK